MQKKILIVEDESMIALDLELILTAAGYEICGIADSVEEATRLINKQHPELVLLDIHLKGSLNGIDLAASLTARNIAFVYLSANFQSSILEKAKATQPYGFLIKPFRENDLLITLDVAFFRHRNSMESKLRREQALERVIMDIVNDTIDYNQKLLRIIGNIQPHIPFDYLTITQKQISSGSNIYLSLLRIGFDDYQHIGVAEMLNITGLNITDFKKLQNESIYQTKLEYYNDDEFLILIQRNRLIKLISKTFQLQSCLNLPVLTSKGDVFTISFFSRKADCYQQDHLHLLKHIDNILGSAIEYILDQISDERGVDSVKLTENPSLVSEKNVFEKKIVGNSHQMLTVQDMISIVAPLDTSVLILGESGTGKERIARSIHELSLRSIRPLVIVNCASLPASLIESELFGHEKGSFTGAVERRIGKFELADKGTIFLDEIGEMPQELQVKLLRVLQEQEIERIGGKGAIKINVRIIAATNRNLEKEVEEGRFRLDLYYRLYVFPILIPPLRERVDDIPALAEHFISHYSAKNGKKVIGISPDALDQLLTYHWPGNVRELEHMIERSMLLTNGTIIQEVLLPKLFANTPNSAKVESRLKSNEENARDHILTVLKKCKGRVSGVGGAAEILDMQPTTLHSKIKKLGIRKEDI